MALRETEDSLRERKEYSNLIKNTRQVDRRKEHNGFQLSLEIIHTCKVFRFRKQL